MNPLDKESPKGDFDYRAIAVRLRGPRIAIVFPNRDQWPFLSGLAIYHATKIWGGANFILIPHDDGEIAPCLLNLAAKYDPDHVVTIRHFIGVLMELSPTEYQLFVGGEPQTSDYVQQNFPDQESQLSNKDEVAREKVAMACTPFLHDSRDDDLNIGRRLFSVEHLSNRSYSDLVNVNPENPNGQHFDFMTADIRYASLLFASHSGSPEVPEVNPTVALNEKEMIEILSNIPSRNVAGEFGWSLGAAWQASMEGLTPISKSWLSEPVTWLVVGSSAIDFALAHNLQRIHGRAIWIPSEWLEVTSPYHQIARNRLSSSKYENHDSSTVRIISTSEDLDSLRTKCLAVSNWAVVDSDTEWLVATHIEELKNYKWSRSMVAMHGDHDQDIALPVRINKIGDIRLANNLPPFLPHLTHLSNGNHLSWITDYDFEISSMPRGKGLSPRVLETDARPWNERIRSARDGISVMSKSFGFIPAGSSLRQSVARPCISLPSLRTWVATKSEDCNLELMVSDAGILSELASQLWNDPVRMGFDFFTDQDFFREFLTDTDQTSRRYPKDDGCVIRLEGFLTIEGAFRTLKHLGDIDEVRKKIDNYTSLGVLIRGFILQCPSCRLNQFVSIDSTPLICARCRNEIPLNRNTWRKPMHEPRWYYDLHQVLRRLFADAGDVSILAAHHLRSQFPGLQALPEMELKSEEFGIMEIDFIGGNSDITIVGEAKSSPKFPTKGRKQKVESLIRIAKCVSADEILLVAGESGFWSPSIIDRFKSALASETWASGYPPRIRLITGARSSSLSTQIMN